MLDYPVNLLYNEILKEHGIFFDKFIDEHIRTHIRPKVLSKNINLKNIHKKYYSFLNIKDYEILNLKLINQIEVEIKRVFDYIFFSTFKNHKIIEKWYYKNNKTKECHICKHDFKLTHIPNWVYIRTHAYKDCCFNCKIVEKNNKKSVIINTKKFVDACGFIPPSDYSFLNNEFTSRIKTNWENIIKAYAKVGHPWYIKELFPSWFHLLNEAGILETIKTGRGIKCLANDGHLCNSLAEKEIDDWLFKNKIQHEKEPLYPTHEKYNPNTRKRADWLVNDIFIEYFGLVGDNKYDKSILEKKQIATENNIELIEIYPKDLLNIGEKLLRLK